MKKVLGAIALVVLVAVVSFVTAAEPRKNFDRPFVSPWDMTVAQLDEANRGFGPNNPRTKENGGIPKDQQNIGISQEHQATDWSRMASSARCIRFKDGFVVFSHRGDRGQINSIAMTKAEWTENLPLLLDGLQAQNLKLEDGKYTVNKVDEGWLIESKTNDSQLHRQTEELPAPAGGQRDNQNGSLPRLNQ